MNNLSKVLTLAFFITLAGAVYATPNHVKKCKAVAVFSETVVEQRRDYVDMVEVLTAMEKILDVMEHLMGIPLDMREDATATMTTLIADIYTVPKAELDDLPARLLRDCLKNPSN